MRILLVSTQDYLHHPIPSRHHYIFEILADKHEIHVPHFHVARNASRPTKLNVHEATLLPLRTPALHWLLNAPYHGAVFRRIIREHSIDVVVASNVLAGSAAIRAANKFRVPVLFDLKDWFPDSAAAYYSNRIFQHLVRKYVFDVTIDNLSKSDLITTVSPGLVDKLSSLGFDAELIPNGVDTSLFRLMDRQTAMSARDAIGIGRDEFVMGFVGAVERWYALDEVIKALARILNYRPDSRLLIVGGSLFTENMRTLVALSRSLGIYDKIIFTGPLSHDQLPTYINMMDVCLIPLAPPEWRKIALPDKFFEYSACNKPILLTRIPGVIELGGPHLFVYDDYDGFVKTTIRLIDDPPHFKLDCQEYSWTLRAEQFEKTLYRLIE